MSVFTSWKKFLSTQAKLRLFWVQQRCQWEWTYQKLTWWTSKCLPSASSTCPNTANNYRNTFTQKWPALHQTCSHWSVIRLALVSFQRLEAWQILRNIPHQRFRSLEQKKLFSELWKHAATHLINSGLFSLYCVLVDLNFFFLFTALYTNLTFESLKTHILK